MLHVKETRCRARRFPVIDVHTHVTFRAKRPAASRRARRSSISAPPRDVLPAMDRRNIRIMVNLTGSAGEGLSEAIRTFQQPHPDRFVVFTEPSWDRVAESRVCDVAGRRAGAAKAAGARGIKVLKTLGLYVREQVTSGPLIPIDDKRFDPMWEACGALGFPVAIHIADPEAFFLPIDRFNERYEELHEHPDWSFHGKDYPSFDALIAARDRVLARHPKTTFIGLHVGHDSENLARVGEALDKFPNFNVEIGARIGELGRQPRTSRQFFDRYQDRILFGTDAVPGGTDMPQQIFGDNLYSIYFQVSRNRGRILRLRAGKDSAARALAHLRPRAAGGNPAEGVLRQRRTHHRDQSLNRRTEEIGVGMNFSCCHQLLDDLSGRN